MADEASRDWIITSGELIRPRREEEVARDPQPAPRPPEVTSSLTPQPEGAGGWTSATRGAAAADGTFRADLVARIKAEIQSPDFDLEARLDAIVPDLLRELEDPE